MELVTFSDARLHIYTLRIQYCAIISFAEGLSGVPLFSSCNSPSKRKLSRREVRTFFFFLVFYVRRGGMRVRLSRVGEIVYCTMRVWEACIGSSEGGGDLDGGLKWMAGDNLHYRFLVLRAKQVSTSRTFARDIFQVIKSIHPPWIYTKLPVWYCEPSIGSAVYPSSTSSAVNPCGFIQTTCECIHRTSAPGRV